MAKKISPAFLATALLCALVLLAPLAAFSLRQDEGGKIVGRVIERDSGRPLAAEIGLAVYAQGGITMKHVRATEQGQFEIAGLPRGEMHLATKLKGYAVERHGFQLNEGETRQIEFRLINAGIVKGRIVNEAGDPVADAQIRAIYADDPATRGAIAATYQWEMGEVRSETTGSFVVEVHPEKEFIVEASHPSFIGEVSTPMRLASIEGLSPLKLSLSQGESFEGEVRDQNGVPIANAQVRLMETEERAELQRFVSFELLKQRAKTTISDATGKFRFDQVIPARKTLIVTHPKYQPVRHRLNLTSDRGLAPMIVTPKSKHER